MITDLYITLNNGVTMPRVGFGVFGLKGASCFDSVATALRLGYRMIDTAQHYENEAEVGRAIKESDVARKDIFLTSKLWNEFHGFERALQAFEESLERLEMDYIDLYLIHFPQPDYKLFFPTWQALEKLYREKKIRAIGLSNFNIEHIQHIIDYGKVIPAVNQIEIHPKMQQTELLNYHRANNIITVACSPLGRGHLEDSTIKHIAIDQDCSSAQAVLHWHLKRDIVPIPKSGSPERIAENIDIFGLDLTAQQMSTISELDEGQRIGHDPNTFHTELRT
jgi:diketogulonate reductase-like aldo/keto reductase